MIDIYVATDVREIREVLGRGYFPYIDKQEIGIVEIPTEAFPEMPANITSRTRSASIVFLNPESPEGKRAVRRLVNSGLIIALDQGTKH